MRNEPLTERRSFLRDERAESRAGGSPQLSAYAEFFRGASRLSLHKVLVDTGLKESVAFGAIAASNDFPIHVCAKLDNWYDELDLVWRQQRAPIAGLTRHGPLFRLERFAWERGRRVVFRGEHLWSRDCICHSLSGRREAVATASDLIAAGADWAEALAVSVPFAKPEGRPWSVAFDSVGELSCNEPLYSWVIG